MLWVRLAGVLPWSDRLKAHDAHQTLDASCG
jgi:hypothetical protein